MKRTLFVLLLITSCTLFYSCQENDEKDNEAASANPNSDVKPTADVQPNTYPLPSGWGVAGSNPGDYNMGLDAHGGINNSKAATIQSKTNNLTASEFGTLMQSREATGVTGKKMRMSGYVKSSNVNGWAGLWMRVDCKNNKPGDFDNMQNRAVKGTTDWTKFDIVLKIDTSAVNIAYGALLAGSGQIWFDQVKFDVVPDNTPTTNLASNGQPANLDFEK